MANEEPVIKSLGTRETLSCLCVNVTVVLCSIHTVDAKSFTDNVLHTNTVDSIAMETVSETVQGAEEHHQNNVSNVITREAGDDHLRYNVTTM